MSLTIRTARAGSTQNRGNVRGTRWTPARLAAALREVLGAEVCDRTIRRACDRGEVPGARRTSGGHWRIPDATVRALWPGLAAPTPSLAA